MRKNLSHIFLFFAILALASGCKKDEIEAYKAEDCAVNFRARTNAFSLRGLKEDTKDLVIPIDLVGPSVDYDREIAVSIENGTGVQGRDFELVSASIPAGELQGSIVLRVNKFKEGETAMDCTISLMPNEYFREGYPNYQKSTISWTELYSRPSQEVWRAWYLFFCPGYSQNLHKIIVETFGDEVEHYTNSVPKEEGQIRKMPTWWYSASRELRDVVKKHDDANPNDPYMHSADYEVFKTYTIPIGEGTKPETLPTIYETLNVY